MGAMLAKFLVRMITYFLGLIVVLALVGAAAFVIARPQIDEFVISEIKKRGLEAESWDLGFNGRANLHNVEMQLPDGVTLKAARISGRPPLAGLAGAATAYDLHIRKGDFDLTIPELDMSGLVQHEKDPKVSSSILQALYRFDIGQISADRVAITQNDHEIAIINEFVLDNLSRGKIDRVSWEQLETHLDKAERGTLRSGAVELRHIDLEAAFPFSHQAAPIDKIKTQEAQQIIGLASFHDLTFHGDIATKPVEIKLGSLTSQGLSLIPSELVPFDILKDYVAAYREEGLDQAQIVKNLLPLARAIKNIDATLDNVNFTSPAAEISLQSVNIQADNWENIMPERMAFTMKGLVLHITNPPAEIAPILSTTGYDKIAMEAAMHMQWRADSQQLNLEDLSFNTQNVGDFSLAFQLDDVDLWPLIEGKALESWLQKLRLHELDLSVRDRGAITNFATIIADIGTVEREEIQQMLENIARRTPSILFKDETLATSARQALLAFLQQSGLLRMHIASREETGLALAQIMADEVDWPSILAITDIRFSHEETVKSR